MELAGKQAIIYLPWATATLEKAKQMIPDNTYTIIASTSLGQPDFSPESFK